MKALSILIKPASGRCNMRCSYCFYRDVADHREEGDRGMMSEETLERIVRAALCEAGEFCAFGFQGGEPTLRGLPFFERFRSLVARHNPRKIPVSFALQTNGLLIDGAWATFLAQSGFLTGLSIDGTAALHDSLRPDAAGNPTHRRALRAAERLRRAGAPLNILTVVTPQLAAKTEEVYRYFKSQNFDHLQFIPCLGGEEASPHVPSSEQYGDFLCRLFDCWAVDFERGQYTSIRLFDNYVHMVAGYPPESCAMAGHCAPYALIEADGAVYPCDFYAVDKHYLGNIHSSSFKELLGGDSARRFAGQSHRLPDQCRSCRHLFLCRGGCRRERVAAPHGADENRYCTAYFRFFEHAAPTLRRIAASVFQQSAHRLS